MLNVAIVTQQAYDLRAGAPELLSIALCVESAGSELDPFGTIDGVNVTKGSPKQYGAMRDGLVREGAGSLGIAKDVHHVEARAAEGTGGSLGDRRESLLAGRRTSTPRRGGVATDR